MSGRYRIARSRHQAGWLVSFAETPIGLAPTLYRAREVAARHYVCASTDVTISFAAGRIAVHADGERSVTFRTWQEACAYVTGRRESMRLHPTRRAPQPVLPIASVIV